MTQTNMEVENVMVIIDGVEMPLEVSKDTIISFENTGQEIVVEKIFDNLVNHGTTIRFNLDSVDIEVLKEIATGGCENCLVNELCDRKQTTTKAVELEGNYVRDKKKCNCENCTCNKEEEDVTETNELADFLTETLLTGVAMSELDNLKVPSQEEIEEVSKALEEVKFSEGIKIADKASRMLKLLNIADELEGNVSGTKAIELVERLKKGLNLFEEIKEELGLNVKVLQDIVVEERINVIAHIEGKTPLKPYCSYRNRRTLHKGVVRTEILDKHNGELLAFGESTLEEFNGDLARAEVASSYRSRMAYSKFSLDSFLARK